MARILVVDDEPDLLVGLKDLLSGYRHEVTTAADGQAALDLIAEVQPAIIILDVVMPNMSGLELCRRIKDDPVTADILVVFLSARSLDSDIEAGMAAGADAYLRKPFEILEVGERIDALLDQQEDS